MVSLCKRAIYIRTTACLCCSEMWHQVIRFSHALFDRPWINVETGRRPATSAHRPRVSELRTSDTAVENTSFINTEAPLQPAARRSDARQGVVGGMGGWRGEEKQQDFVFSHLPDNRSHRPQAGGTVAQLLPR